MSYNSISPLKVDKIGKIEGSQGSVECLCFCINASQSQHECRCFMFRSKRSLLVKRLLKLRIVSSKNETTCEDASKDDLVKSVANSLLKRLKETTLESLANAVENKGISSECIMLPKEGLRLGKRTVNPHVLCCQLWRWPELTGEHMMKALPECTSSDSNSICCNPFHWSRLILPGKPKKQWKYIF